MPYLVRTRELLPGVRHVYYADTRHFPYGERSAAEVRRIVVEATAGLVSAFDPAVVVVACNTASVVALDELRKRFTVPFVGVVPAIKPAAALGAGAIGVLASSRTVEDPYVSDLIRRFAPDREVVLVAAPGLIELVEHRLYEHAAAELAATLAEPLVRLGAAGVASVVLGCTHFIHVKDRIGERLGEGVTLVDSVEGVARQTVRLMREHTYGADSTAGDAGKPGGGAGTAVESTGARLLVSDPIRASGTYRELARRFHLEYGQP